MERKVERERRRKREGGRGGEKEKRERERQRLTSGLRRGKKTAAGPWSSSRRVP